MQYNVMWCNAKLYKAMRYNITQYNAIKYNKFNEMQYIKYNTIL